MHTNVAPGTFNILEKYAAIVPTYFAAVHYAHAAFKF